MIKICDKQGYYFSIDAMIAVLIILGVVLFIRPHIDQTRYESNVQDDLLQVLTSVKIGEINNTYVNIVLNASGKIKNPNQSVLEQIGEMYANSDPAYRTLAQEIINDLNLKENVAIYFGNDLIANVSKIPYANATQISVSRLLISGIQSGTGATGFSSRASLYTNNRVDYFYFGGYVGDGNLSVLVNGDIIGARIEGVFNTGFDLSINGINQGSYAPTVPEEPYRIDFTPAMINNFIDGNNIISFASADDNLYIAGGYLRVIYNYSTTPKENKNKFIPGIEGLVNLYDSFYVPGNIKNLNMSIHYNSSQNLFLTVGNVTLFEGNSSGLETTQTFDNATLAAALNNFAGMGEKTIPIRFGLRNASYVVSIHTEADVVSVSDLSGSMCDCVEKGGCCEIYGCGQTVCENTCGGNWQWWWGWYCANDYCRYDQSYCESECGSTCEGGIYEAKDANKIFVNTILNSTGNRAGLVGYRGEVSVGDIHDLSKDNVSLMAEVDSWNAQGGTCICCGINYAANMLNTQSFSNRTKAIIIMSDGEANYACAAQGTGDAKLDAIQAAEDAYDNYNITVHAIGFGPNVDSNTLQDIAIAGHGDYYFGDITNITEVYQKVAENVVEATYSEQTITGEGIYSRLYPDSYIGYEYDSEPTQGMLITAETETFDTNAPIGNFFIPANSTPEEIEVISYSGSKWTSKVQINNSDLGGWTNVYDLGEYNNSFVNLGDPYVVNVPRDLVAMGNNSVNVSIGIDANNYTNGSQYNKIIYSVAKNYTSFSPILSVAEGCNWTVEFEGDVFGSFLVPPSYGGSDKCYYNSSIGPSEDYVDFHEDDAIEYAISLLLKDLDLNNNGKIDTAKFDEGDLSISSTEIAGIPFTWDTEVQARIWI